MIGSLCGPDVLFQKKSVDEMSSLLARDRNKMKVQIYMQSLRMQM